MAPQWYDSEDAQVVEYAKKNKLPYINFYELLKETGIDYETDTYDGGLHMNLSGCRKVIQISWKCFGQGLWDQRSSR